MNQGRIEQIGTPDEVFHRPASEFVVSFLGEVNRFHGRVAHGRVEVDELGLAAPLPGDAADGSCALAWADGAPARVFMRPHELALAREGGGQPGSGFSATITRVNAAGPSVRLDLASEAGRPLVATVSSDELEREALAVGDRVVVTPRKLQVFADPGQTGSSAEKAG
jgi:sulfate transport system ATP-binding protein